MFLQVFIIKNEMKNKSGRNTIFAGNVVNAWSTKYVCIMCVRVYPFDMEKFKVHYPISVFATLQLILRLKIFFLGNVSLHMEPLSYI